MKVLVVEVSEEPEHSGPEHLAKEHDKRGKVEDEDHTSQPVKKHHRTYMKLLGGGCTCTRIRLSIWTKKC